MRDMKVLVTGGAGFIGSNLATALCEDNDVTIIDNLSTGRLENIKALTENHAVKLFQGDVSDLHFMTKACSSMDVVMHQAAIPSVPRSLKSPMASNNANVSGTLASLMAAHECGVKRFVYASSSSVYGDTPTLPKKENMPPSPLSPYAVSKLAGEYYVSVFAKTYGMKAISLRYFNVYGPRQDPESEYAAVVPRFMKCALRSEPMPVYGDGNQTRDLTYVKDVIRANILAAESEATGVVNIASGRQVTIGGLAKSISRLMSVEPKIHHLPPRSGDIRDSLADISLAGEMIGYSPSYTLEQGLRETVDFFKM